MFGSPTADYFEMCLNVLTLSIDPAGSTLGESGNFQGFLEDWPETPSLSTNAHIPVFRPLTAFLSLLVEFMGKFMRPTSVLAGGPVT